MVLFDRSTAIEFYEMLNANVRERKQVRPILRNYIGS
jgi:hypothetical protein